VSQRKFLLMFAFFTRVERRKGGGGGIVADGVSGYLTGSARLIYKFGNEMKPN